MLNYVNILSLMDIQDQSRWIMLFPMFPNITPYVESCTIPDYSFSTDDQTKAITGFNFLDDVSINFKEDDKGTVQFFLYTLEALTWDRYTKTFRDNQRFAKQFAIIIMDTYEIGAMTLGWRFYNLRYKGKDTLNLDQNGGGPLLITAHFSVEQIEPMYPRNQFGLLPIP